MQERQFWTDDRLRRLGVALLIALCLACIVKFVNDSDNSSALKRGDFPGILSPAIILAQGQAARLYDLNLHHQIQRSIWPSFGEEMYISVYPPYFGALLLPLAYLDPLAARNIWTLLSLLSYFAALLILRPLSPALREHFLFCSISLLLFAPVLFGVLGGQNSAFSMLLFAVMVRLLQCNIQLGNFWAGVSAGLWLFKPQFGVLAGVFLLAQRRWPAVVGFFLVAILYWIIGAYYLGTDWILTWSRAAQEFAAINFTINDFQMASIAGALSSLARHSLFPQEVIMPASIVASVVLLVSIWRKTMQTGWLLAPLLVLISPQTLFYDLSIVAAASLPFLKFNNDREVNAYLALGCVAAVFFALRSYFFFSLPFVLAVGALVFIYRRARIET